jgi:hypothetical protein
MTETQAEACIRTDSLSAGLADSRLSVAFKIPFPGHATPVILWQVSKRTRQFAPRSASAHHAPSPVLRSSAPRAMRIMTRWSCARQWAGASLGVDRAISQMVFSPSSARFADVQKVDVHRPAPLDLDRLKSASVLPTSKLLPGGFAQVMSAWSRSDSREATLTASPHMSNVNFSRPTTPPTTNPKMNSRS